MTARDARATARSASSLGPSGPGYGARFKGWRSGTAFTSAEYSEAARAATRVLRILERATPEHVTSGLLWYGLARAQTERAAQALSVPVEHAVAALSAASPGRDWGSNVRALEAARDIRDGASAQDAARAHGLSVGLTGYAPLRRAAVALRDGLSSLGGPKVGAFALGVLHSGATEHVCVDGHAALAAAHGPVSKRPGITQAEPLGARAYDVLSLAYATAARAWGSTPAEAQAVAWVSWRAIPLQRAQP